MTEGSVAVAEAADVIKEIFARHRITDPNQARRILRENATQDELDRYRAAIEVLDGMGVLG